MNYNEALDYIHGTKKFGSKLGLDNIRHLLNLLDNPQKDLKIIHIAGTNGKGSTASFITSILKEGNLRVGLFTSPYLETFTERIRINDENIPEDKLAKITEIVKVKVEEMVEDGYNHPTEFEIVTAIAFLYYMEENVDYVVLEVGLGGRFDSTNVIDNSLISVITPIAMDHMEYLGDTLGKIAYEKAGIIKENGLVISYEQDPEAKEVIIQVAKEKNAKLVFVPIDNIKIKETRDDGNIFDFSFGSHILKDLNASLLGEHQIFNASIALTTILTLIDEKLINISDEDIRNGLKSTKWMGRLEVLRRKPTFLIDGAHNLQGIQSLRRALKEIFNYNKLILGVGMLEDKDVDSMVPSLVDFADTVIVTEPNIFRAMKADELGKRVAKYNENYIVEGDINKAIEKSLEIAGDDDLIVFAGSLYLIGDVRKIASKK